jgi:hypothetical protein
VNDIPAVVAGGEAPEHDAGLAASEVGAPAADRADVDDRAWVVESGGRPIPFQPTPAASRQADSAAATTASWCGWSSW